MILDEFLFRLGIKADSAKLNAFAQTLDRVENSSVSQTLGGVADAAGRAGDAAKNAGDESQKAADKTGNAFDKAKGKINKFKGAFTFFIGLASALSVGLVRSYNTMLQEIDKLAASKNQLFLITEKEVAQSKEYTANVSRTSELLQSLKVRIGLGLLPVLNRLVNTFTMLLINNKSLISEGLMWFFKVLVSIVEGILRFIAAIDNVISGTIGWKAALLALVVVLGFIKRAMLAAFLTNPITWVVLAVLAVIAIVDDLITYLRGGKSAFGAFWGPAIEWAKRVWAYVEPFYRGWEKATWLLINAIRKIFSALWDYVSGLFGIWGDATLSLTDKIRLSFEKTLQFIRDWFAAGFEFILGLFGFTLDDATQFIKGIGDQFARVADLIKKPFAAAFAWLEAAYDKTVGRIMRGINWVGTKLGLIDEDKVPGNLAAIGASTSQSIVTTNNGGDVNATINLTSPDPARAGESVKEALAPSYARANNNLRGGVKF